MCTDLTDSSTFIQSRIKELRSANYKPGKYSSENQTVTNQARKMLLSAQNSARQIRKKLLREALTKNKIRFFGRIDNDDIHQTKQGVPVTYNPPPVTHVLQARRQIASIFGASSQNDRRIEALQSLIELCHVREPHRMNPASRVSKGATFRNSDALSGLEVQGKDDVQDLQNAFETIELIPLVLPSTMCLFCLSDAKLISEVRTALYSRIDSLRRYINHLYLSHYGPDEPLIYPYPSCDSSL